MWQRCASLLAGRKCASLQGAAVAAGLLMQLLTPACLLLVLVLLLQAPRGQATACCKLGIMYHQQGLLEQAVSYFERFYELARSLGESCCCVWVRQQQAVRQGPGSCASIAQGRARKWRAAAPKDWHELRTVCGVVREAFKRRCAMLPLQWQGLCQCCCQQSVYQRGANQALLTES